jgi:mannosyl-3-phosphoglycerate phosphatase
VKAPAPGTPLLVFTDLDGTLLDHDTYDWTPAAPALGALRAAGVPVVPVSSKTLAELDHLCARIGLDGPRVGENGTLVAWPGEPPHLFGPGIDAIRGKLAALRQRTGWQFRGFADMSASEIAERTGLDQKAAARAAQRLASEPLLWEDSDAALAAFQLAIAGAGLTLLQGGRFLHVLGQADKGKALAHVAQRLTPAARTVALGDSPNDRAMLLAVDLPVIVRKKDGSAMSLPERPDARVTDLPGPAGWNQVMLELLRA